MTRKIHWGLAGLFIAAHAVLSVLLLYGDSLTSDEPIHMTAGFLAVKDRDLRINREHPPLAKALAGLGLMTGGFSFPYSERSYEKGKQYDLAMQFLFGRGNAPVSMTARARWPLLLVSLEFCVFLFLFARRLYGDRAALISLLLYALSPTVLAHNHLVTTDSAGMIFGFAGIVLVLLAFEGVEKHPQRGCRKMAGRSFECVFAGGIGIGLAMLSKFSGLVDLAFVVLIGAAGLLFYEGQRLRLFLITGLVILLSLMVLLLGCWTFGANTPGGSGPLWQYWDGLRIVRAHLDRGHDLPQFLFGDCSFMGWWYYFPAAFFLKTSIFLQGLLILSVVQALRKTPQGESRPHPILFHSLWMFPIFYTGYCITGRLNIGFRHMMPVLPFLYVFVGVNIDRLLRTPSRSLRCLLFLLLAGYGMSTLLRYPICMGYFTEWAGSHPERYLNDSNLDWGQDLARLAAFMNREGIEHIRLDYFGPRDAPDAYLGGRYERWSKEKGLPGEGWFAVSEFSIMASRCYKRMGVTPWDYSGLENFKPVARVGSSIRVYRFP